MNSSVGQLSAVAAILQCSSNKQRIILRDKSIGRHPSARSILKGNTWVLLDFKTSGIKNILYLLFLCKQDSLLTAVDYPLFNFFSSLGALTRFMLNSCLSNLSFAFRPLCSSNTDDRNELMVRLNS